jgi:dipeptidyl aminopeptidase/acylaminoacyl peptidase
MRLYLFILLCLLQLATFSQNGKDPVKVTDLLKVKQLSGVTLHPDGTKAVFVVNSVEPDAASKWEYKYMNQLYVADLTSGTTRQLTTAKEGASQPVWSPDGKQLAFVRAVEGKPQIFLLNLDGGEPTQLTSLKSGASNPRWSPDSRRMLFSVNVSLTDLLTDSIFNPNKTIPAWPYEKPGFAKNEQFETKKITADPDGNIDEVRAYLLQNEKDKKAKVLDKLDFQEEAGVSSEFNFNHWMIMNVSPASTPKPITKGFFSFGNPRFVGNSNKIIVETNLSETQHPDRALETEVYIMNDDGSGLKKLIAKKDINYNNVSVSPSGNFIAFNFGPTSYVSVPALGVMPVNGTEKDIVVIPFDRNKGNLTWSNDEQSLWFSAQSNGGAVIAKADLKTKKVQTLTSFDEGISSFDIKNNNIVYVKTNINSPFELYTSDLSFSNVKQLSNLNTEWIRNKKISVPEKGTFVNEKGTTIEYWVMKPYNYQEGKKYPAILEIHGGPAAMWGPGESSMWHEYQYYTSQGYVVVYSNPRGSGGYGTDFLRGNVNDWGTGPTRDVLTALDKSVVKGFIDTTRLAVTGGSYAGYLVAWIIAHDNRFKVACSQRGVYDLATFFGEGNAWRLVPNYFGGYPWEPKVKEVLVRESPITYVQNVTTPYIMFHGENDLRTGVIQGEMFYKSLKVLGRTVEYVRHPGATHEITRSGNNRQRIDQMLRTMEFFDRFIKK